MRGTSAGVTACSPFDAVPRSLICSDQAATPIGMNHAGNAAYTVHVALLDAQCKGLSTCLLRRVSTLKI